jgi:hypothetical protein
MIARLLTLLALGSAIEAQELRVAIDAAPIVVIGTHQGVESRGSLLAHRVRVVASLKGDPGNEVSVLECTEATVPIRPVVAETRLYCLHPVWNPDESGLPSSHSYRMDQHSGSHPPIALPLQEAARPPELRLVDILLQAQRAGSIAAGKQVLLDLALTAPPATRFEAARLLLERSTLRDSLNPIELGTILAKTGSEVLDLPYKLTLASICAERRVPELLDALCLCWPQIDDDSFSQAVGRFARDLHGEGATERLLPYLRRAGRGRLRSHVLMALGATSTDSALHALRRLRRLEVNTSAIDAALELHGANAVDAVVARRNAPVAEETGSVR